MPTNDQTADPSISLTAPSEPGTLLAPSHPVPLDPNNPPWGIGGAVLVLVGSIVLQIGFSLLFFLPYLIRLSLRPDAPANLVEVALADKTAVLLQVIAILPAQLFSLALVWAVVTRFGKLPFLAPLGLKWSGYPWLWGSVGLGVVLCGVGSGLAWLLGGETPTKLDEIINSSLAARYTLAALAVFTAPLVEELIYRGVLYSALHRLAGVLPAVVIVLGIFTLIHVPQYWPNFGVIAAVGLLSISLTVVRAYSGRLLPCVVIHLVFNGIQALVLVIEPHIPKLAQPGEIAVGILWRLSMAI
ncbi:MAG: CPBP family intramembrane metalloprotease [Pyrinomonadaceae bacterium]|nr:CPBP family intramembrane metalloprotease [Pyrinomonadaceae bacterium]